VYKYKHSIASFEVVNLWNVVIENVMLYFIGVYLMLIDDNNTCRTPLQLHCQKQSENPGAMNNNIVKQNTSGYTQVSSEQQPLIFICAITLMLKVFLASYNIR